MQKICFKCKETKAISEFYKHPKMSDGHLNKCKECNKADVLKHRLENIEKIRQYDRDRAKHPERMRAKAEINKIWLSQDKRRKKAHSAVYSAVKSGKLIRQPCCRCGEQKTVAHHEDYDKPLDVVWLCQPCHKQRHKEIDAA